MSDIVFYFFLIICGGVAGWCWALVYANTKAARERSATPTITIPKGTTRVTVTTYGGGGGGGIDASHKSTTIDFDITQEDKNGGA